MNIKQIEDWLLSEEGNATFQQAFHDVDSMQKELRKAMQIDHADMYKPFIPFLNTFAKAILASESEPFCHTVVQKNGLSQGAMCRTIYECETHPLYDADIDEIVPLYLHPSQDKARIAESLHERDKLGHVVVKVITAIEDLIAEATEYEDDDGFTYQSSPLDLWSALNDALEDMPKLAGEDRLAKLELENKTLREALGAYIEHCKLNSNYPSDFMLQFKQALATQTSTEQLDAYRNSVIEECAKLCDEADKSMHPSDLADKIRAMANSTVDESVPV